MKVAVTGANGFVGRYLIDRLLNRGDQVVVISRQPCQFQDIENAPIEHHVTDYSYQDLAASMAGVDAIVHLSAMRSSPEIEARGFHPFYETNVSTTENIFLAARYLSISCICLASSIAVYSTKNSVPYREDHHPFPLSFYGASKLACEHLATIYSRQLPGKIISLRFAQIFGFGERRGLALTKFIEQARRKQPITIWGNGQDARDYIYVKDVVNAIETSLIPAAPAGVFNIGSGMAYSMLEIAETINSVFDNPTPICFDNTKPGAAYNYYMDISAARNLLGWQPQWPLRTAVEDIRYSYQDR